LCISSVTQPNNYQGSEYQGSERQAEGDGREEAHRRVPAGETRRREP